jgi:glycine oxidase
MTTVAIVGAGLVGRLLAVQLARQKDVSISLFDEDSTEGENAAAYLAAAMLAPLAESVDASEMVTQMGERSLQLWPEILALLDEPVFFQHKGSLILSYEQDRPYLEDFYRRLKRSDQAQVISSQQIADIEPCLKEHARRFSAGLFLPNEGQLDNRQLLSSSATTIQNLGVKWLSKTTVELDLNSSKVNGESFDWIFDCRGLGAQDDLPKQNKLRGVRGEVIRLHAPDVELSRPTRLIHPRYPIYIAPKQNHQFVVGATQIESEDRRQPTLRSAMELLSSCFSVHSGFAEAEILELKSGLRPALLDNEPKIIHRKHNNIIQINGLYRHGFLISPALVEQAICLMTTTDNNQDLPVYNKLIEVIDK